jgi:hypothetical protein
LVTKNKWLAYVSRTLEVILGLLVVWTVACVVGITVEFYRAPIMFWSIGVLGSIVFLGAVLAYHKFK